MSEVRWVSIITSVLLCCWLWKKHIAQLFYDADRKVFAEDVVDIIVHCFALLTASNSILRQSSDCHCISQALWASCESLLELLEAASISKGKTLETPSHSWVPSPAPSQASYDGSVDAGKGGEVVVTEAETSVHFQRLQKRPNVHAGIHYSDVSDEYDTPANVDTLIEEDCHWWVETSIEL